jgi:uncharacterized protein (TIGR00266 family)
MFRGDITRSGSAARSSGSKLTLAWSYCTGAPISASPVVHNGIVYIGSLANTLTALDIRTGKKESANVDWQTRMTGQSFGQKIIGAIKRKLMGESLFWTYFQATGAPGEVGFAGHYPGKIQVFELAPGQSIMVQRDGFLFAQSTVTLDIALVRRLGAGLLGGEGFILQKLTGPGAVFVHAGGDHVDFTLGPGEMLQVQAGHLVAFEPTVNYDIQMVGSIRTAIFGGEGLFLTTLTGPGRVILQSMTLERLRHELAPGEHPGAGEERNPLGALARGDFGSFFSTDD